MSSPKTRARLLSTFTLLTLTAVVAYTFAQPAPQQPSDLQREQELQQQSRPQPGPFPDLLGGLKATPGCLGVDTADTQSGKKVIFAWFENKKAALNWYYSDVHKQVMKIIPTGDSGHTHKPLENVADDVPIMAIASLTFSNEPKFEQTQLPISQIAIELYTPLEGGLFLGSRFAPDTVKVNNMTDLSKSE